MSGGPAKTDTFDLKSNHENGGEFKEIETKAPDCDSANTSRNWPNTAIDWQSSVV